MAEFKDTFLTYKGKPLVRCKNELYYGNMADPYVVYLKVLSNKGFKDISLSEKVSIQLLSTDPEISPKEKVVKKSEKSGLFNALDVGAIWLERWLKK